MTSVRPAPLPLKHRLYLVARRDGTAIALVEARDDEQAASRATYVMGQVALAGWCGEVQVMPAKGYRSGVPVFLDGFFQSQRPPRLLH